MAELHIYEESRPWGNFRRFTQNEASTVKLLTITSGEAFSLQTHKEREEFWRVISGTPEITIGETTVEAKVGDEFFVHKDEKHRIKAVSGDAVILEIALGAFAEDDIIHLKDMYGRS